MFDHFGLQKRVGVEVQSATAVGMNFETTPGAVAAAEPDRDKLLSEAVVAAVDSKPPVPLLGRTAVPYSHSPTAVEIVGRIDVVVAVVDDSKTDS